MNAPSRWRYGAVAAAFVLLTHSTGAYGVVTGFYGVAGYGVAWSVSDNGTVLVADNQDHPALWTRAGGVVPLNVVNVINVSRISAGATVLAGDGQGVPIRYTMGGSIDQIPATFAEVRGLSGDGQKIFATDTHTTQPFTWTPSNGIQSVPGASGISSVRAGGMSSNGQRLVGYTGTTGWTYDPGSGFQLASPHVGFTHTEFQGISRDGNTVFGGAWIHPGINFEGTAFVWTSAGGYVDLGTLPSVPAGSDHRYRATASSTNGALIAGTYADRLAWIWDPQNGTRDLRAVLANELHLDMTGWTLEQVMDVSPDGTIVVGQGIFGNGENRGFIAIIPGPGSVTVLACGGMVLMRRRRR